MPVLPASQLNAPPSDAAYTKGIDLLNRPVIGFGESEKDLYNYKNWTPMWIPFIQASTNIYKTDPITGELPETIFIPSQVNTAKKDFQIFTPYDHPFLLIDMKVVITTRYEIVDESGTTVVRGSRFASPYLNAGAVPTDGKLRLYMKYLYPGVEAANVSLTAVSPKGRPILGGSQNTTGVIDPLGGPNHTLTVGNQPHQETVPQYSMQNMKSGRGNLQYYILFPENGIVRVTVTNNIPKSAAPQGATNFGLEVSGMLFGYAIMR